MIRSAWGWLGERVRRGAADWDRFWFTPVSPSLLGILRILVGGMVLYTHAVWTLGLSTFFSDDGVLPRAYSRALYADSWTHWTHFDWLGSSNAVWIVLMSSTAVTARPRMPTPVVSPALLMKPCRCSSIMTARLGATFSIMARSIASRMLANAGNAANMARPIASSGTSASSEV